MRDKKSTYQHATKILVVGSGSWATALLKILLFNKKNAYWWLRKQEVIDFISAYRHNPKYLSTVEIGLSPDKMGTELKELLVDKDVVILAVPSAYLPEVIEKIEPRNLANKVLVSAIKGTVAGKNQAVHEYLQQQFGIESNKYVAITGPCHAEEVASEKLSYLTFSSTSPNQAQAVSRLFANRFIKTNTTTDVAGTEYAAILKNIYAILAGICQGVGMGDNFQAVLVSNAMQEMKRFLESAYPMERNLLETCYMGDLLVTAYSQYSRNRTFGRMVGRGYSIKSAQIEMDMVAEGYYATKSIYEIAQNLRIATPMIDSAYHILYNNVAPSIEISLLASLLNQQLS
ncbi:MAG: NAD(P)-binding domain-containing protein [Bacteroidetes bacterium]|nr:NAD(P)-binding domain-containing protein [Bacteroidota bacterium]